MGFVIKRTAYSEHFKELLETKSRYVICYGGRGSGKTHHIILKLIMISFEKGFNHILYVNKEFRHIKTQQYADIKKVIKKHGLEQYFKCYDGDYRIVNLLTGTIFTPIGMDDPEKTKGISDPTVIWWDEISKGKQEDFLTLNALLRTPLNDKHQFIVSFNPVSEKHWLRDYFFCKEDKHTLKDSFADNTYLNRSTYLNNEFIDREAYKHTLEQNASGNVNRMLVDINGEWGVVVNDNSFFYAYSDKNVSASDYSLAQDRYIDLSFDFNKAPTTLVLGQQIGNSWHVFDVILGTEKTFTGLSPLEAVCQLFKRKYIDSGMIAPYRIRVTGDASGRQGSADRMASYNFYTTIQRCLTINSSQLYVRSANLPHTTSQDVCNYPLYRLPILFYPSTDILQNEIVQAYADDKGTLDKAKKDMGLHAVDAWRYLMDFWFNRNNNYRAYVDGIERANKAAN